MNFPRIWRVEFDAAEVHAQESVYVHICGTERCIDIHAIAFRIQGGLVHEEAQAKHAHVAQADEQRGNHRGELEACVRRELGEWVRDQDQDNVDVDQNIGHR